MDDDRAIPPLDGSITPFVGLVDFHAEYNPSLPWVGFPSPHAPDEATYISYLEFAKATHRVAHSIRPSGTGIDREPVALLLHCDVILYIAYIIGLMRVVFVVCLSASSTIELDRLTSYFDSLFSSLPTTPPKRYPTCSKR